MGNPRHLRGIEGASSATAGPGAALNGHYQVSLFVVADNLDTTNDTLEVALEASPDRTHWDPVGTLSTADFTLDDTSGAYTATLNVQAYFPLFRANITQFTDDANGDLTVTAHVMGSGNGAGSGASGQPDGP